MKKILPKLALVLLFVSLVSWQYANNYQQRRHASYSATMLAPNQQYRIDVYFLSAGDPIKVLFRVYDKEQKLLAEYTREIDSGAWAERWTCDAQNCSEFIYSIGEVAPISLPPTWLDGLRAKLP